MERGQTPPEPTAPVAEIFVGIQGEGMRVGTRQAFVRFCGCNRACRYCDTREALEPTELCQVEQGAGSRRFAAWPNPLAVGQVASAVATLLPPPAHHRTVSLTGGEPLLHADFLAALCPRLRDDGFRLYLETNGTLPEAMERIAPHVDHVAMDVKLASATGEPTPWDAHARFLAVCPPRGASVKVVVAAGTTEGELDRVAALVGSVAPTVPTVLQPVTPAGGLLPPAAEDVLAMQERLLRVLADVRVIPQVHKLMGQK